MSCCAPPARLDPLFESWPARWAIHVVHDAAFEPQSCNPGVDARGDLRQPTRFAPIRDAVGAAVPYLYGGSTLACTIFETVFHDVPADAEDKFVDLAAFAGRAHGEVVPTRALRLVDPPAKGCTGCACRRLS